MGKIIFISLLFSFSSPIFSGDRFILTLFHGYEGKDSKDSFKERKEVPPDLKDIGVVKVYDIGHSTDKKIFSQVLNDFNCKNKIQNQKDLKIIIWGYSWGARNTYEFSKLFQDTCGRKADIGYLVDGVQKPISQFRRAPIANYCKNYYKTIYPIRGRPVDNCQNFDLTKTCLRSDGSYLKGMECHQTVIMEGNGMVREDLKKIN